MHSNQTVKTDWTKQSEGTDSRWVGGGLEGKKVKTQFIIDSWQKPGQFWLKTPNNKKWLKTVLVSLLFWWAEWRRSLKCGFGVHQCFPVSQSCGKPLFLYDIYICLATFNFKAAVRVVSWREKKKFRHFLLVVTLPVVSVSLCLCDCIPFNYWNINLRGAVATQVILYTLSLRVPRHLLLL